MEKDDIMNYRVNFHDNGEHTHDLQYATEEHAVESAQGWAERATYSAFVYKRLRCARVHYHPIKAFHNATSPDNPAMNQPSAERDD
jgi:hypothetical protein